MAPKSRSKSDNLAEWYSERGSADLTPEELKMLAADSRTSFKSEVKQTIPKGFMENVLLNLPQLQVIDFDQADTFQIDLFHHLQEQAPSCSSFTSATATVTTRISAASAPHAQTSRR
eukprot:gene1997-biopygen1632